MNQLQPPTAYTPLESLFLFQSLLTHGVDTPAFARVSELLRGNALIKASETYDPARLSPEALQHLFLLLLRDEVRSEAESADAAASKKRKLGSPPLPTLKDAYEHIEKVPALVDRLYSRYREHVVSQIRDDERRFESVQKDIQVLERSERDRLAKLAAQQSAQSTAPPPLAPRDAKAPVVAKGATPSPMPTPTGARKPPTPNTPVLPPKVPTTIPSVVPPVLPPTRGPTATPPTRPSPSPKPPHGTPVLQAPTGVPQQVPRILQAPAQPPKPVSPQPDATKGNEVAGAAQLGTPAAGLLKWEKPYQPLQASPTPPTGQFQSPIPPNTVPSPRPQQSPQSQQQWPQPQPGSYPAQGQAAPQPLQPQNRQPPKSMLASPQNAGHVTQPVHPGAGPRPTGTPVLPPGRPQSNTPVIPPARPLQPQPTRPITSGSPAASAAPPGSIAPPQRWPSAQAQQQPRPSPSVSPAPPAGSKDKPYNSPYVAQPPQPPIPKHMIQQAAVTPGPKRFTGTIPMPKTPLTNNTGSLTQGMGTKWATQSTPSTPLQLNGMEPESPAFEPVSPPPIPSRATSRSSVGQPKLVTKIEASTRSSRGRASRSAQKARGPSATPSVADTRRSQSILSHVDDTVMDQSAATPTIKDEYTTPRPQEETGDTTADESSHGRNVGLTPGLKRKRQDTPQEPSTPVAHVLWTRGFTKVSSSALDQISSHRDANMFATALREKDAPNYRQIVLQPQDITSIRSAIKHGNKAAVQAAGSLPGGDPGTASVWLPISEDLTPPKAIINSAQLERELVHMFCNAIMYNPDPDRGPGPAFMKRTQEEEDEIVGYRLDENGVVKNTQAMFLEVEKLLGELRAAEKERSAPPPTTTGTTRPGSVVSPVEDTPAEEEEEPPADDAASSGTSKRKRATRG